MKRFLILVCVLSLFLVGCDGDSSNIISTDINNYENDCASVCNAADLMPALHELGNCEYIGYTYKIECYSRFFGFYSDGLALFVKYGEEEYAKQKELALAKYRFLEEPVKHGEYYELPVTEFTYRGYLIKVIPDEEYNNYATCHSFAMLGINDEWHTLVYMYYYDFDIDFIAQEGEDLAEEMRYLVDRSFAWDYSIDA